MSGIRCFLCSRVALRHLSVGAHLAACRNAWGGKNSLRSNIMPPVSKHCSAARCASQRCPSALGGELPFAMKIHLRTPCGIARKMVIFKNRHHQNHSEQPGKQRKQDKICLSGAYTRCCYCVISELFCPRCLNEQLFAANNGRPRDVACDSRAKGCYD